MEAERDIQTHFEVTISLVPKPDKNITRKENQEPMSLMNIDVKVINSKSNPTANKKNNTSQLNGIYSMYTGWFNIQKSII